MPGRLYSGSNTPNTIEQDTPQHKAGQKWGRTVQQSVQPWGRLTPNIQFDSDSNQAKCLTKATINTLAKLKRKEAKKLDLNFSKT